MSLSLREPSRSSSLFTRLLRIALPILCQFMITQLVSLVDNLMMGRVGTCEMTGVSVANQVIFVFSLATFGGLSGPSIYASQYHGSGDEEGIRTCVRFKTIVIALLFAVFTVLFLAFAPSLVSFFTTGDWTEEARALVEANGILYLRLAVFTIPPFLVKELFATTLREARETVVPMVASFVAVGVNVVLDAVLIFGLLGLPALGTKGAIIATIIARVIECVIVVIHVVRKRARYPFLAGVFHPFRVPSSFVKHVIGKCLLLTANETLWSLAMTLIMACFATRGLEAAAAYTIASTLSSVFITMGQALGNASQIVLGPILGAGKLDEAKAMSKKIMVFSFLVVLVFSLILFSLAFVVPALYDTTDAIRGLARDAIIVDAIALPVWSVCTVMYFIMRCGGQVLVTFFFDSLYMWVVKLTLTFILVRTTSLSFVPLFAIVQFSDVLKMTIGYILVSRGVWCRRIVSSPADVS